MADVTTERLAWLRRLSDTLSDLMDEIEVLRAKNDSMRAVLKQARRFIKSVSSVPLAEVTASGGGSVSRASVTVGAGGLLAEIDAVLGDGGDA